MYGSVLQTGWRINSHSSLLLLNEYLVVYINLYIVWLKLFYGSQLYTKMETKIVNLLTPRAFAFKKKKKKFPPEPELWHSKLWLQMLIKVKT